MTVVYRIESNWKGTPSAPVWTADLGQSTLLTGPNGGGKSRVVEALQLALTGSVADYLGRKSVKDAKMLWRAKPKGKGPLYVEVHLSDGSVLRWEQARSNGKAKVLVDGEAVVAPVGASLTVAEVRANLFGSPATAEKWLSTQLNITTDEIMALLSEQAEDHPYVWSLTQPFANASTPAALLDGLKKRMRASKSEAETAQTLVEEMQHASGPTVTDAELQAAREKVTTLEGQGRASFERLADIQALVKLESDYKALSTELASLPKPDPQVVAGLATARSIVSTLNTVFANYPANTLCPCCHKNLDAGVASLHKRAKELTEYIGAAQKGASDLDRRKAIEANLAAIKNQASALRPLGAPPAVCLEQVQRDVEAIQRQLSEAQTHLDELQRRRVSTQAPSMAQATVDRASQAHAGYKEAAKMVETIIGDAVTKGVAEFNTAIAKVYPEHLGTPQLTLRPQVSIGIERDGILGAPSGGEESVLMLAIATVISYLKGVENLNLLIMEDRAIDTYTLLSILDNWRECRYAQVFVPTTHKVEGEVEGWEVVDCWTKEQDWDKVAPIPALQDLHPRTAPTL